MGSSEEGGAIYQKAQIAIQSSGNVFVGAVAAFGPNTAELSGRSTVAAKPRYAQKKLSTVAVSGKVLLVERGKVTFQAKALRAQSAGAVACVFINSDDQPFVPFGDANEDEGKVHIPCCCIGRSDGEWLLKTTPSTVSIVFEPEGGWKSRSVAAGSDGDTDRSRSMSAGMHSTHNDASTNPLRLSVATSGNSVADDIGVPTAQIDAKFVSAKYSYESDHARDLVFKKGELIEVLDENKPGSGWWTGRIGARCGIFPENRTVPHNSGALSNRLPPTQPGGSVEESAQHRADRGSSRSRLSVSTSHSSESGAASPYEYDYSKSSTFADVAKHQHQLKQRAVQAWLPVYEHAILSKDPVEIEAAIRRAEVFAGAVGSELEKLKKLAGKIADANMQWLRAQADANMKPKFEADARNLKSNLVEWRRQYRIAKRQAREKGASQPLYEAYLASNEFPHAVESEREKIRRILDSLDVWWEPPRVFGLSLSEICSSGRVTMDACGVPDFFEHWLQRLEATGAATTEGCFRVPGHQEDVKMLKKYYERDSEATGLPMSQLHSNGHSPHEYASLLKMWLRELTEPLIPKALYDDAVGIGKQGPGRGDKQLAKFLAKMPTDNKRIMTRLSDFLKNMDVRKTRMDHSNLAIVFNPCFLRHDDVNVFMSNRDYEIEFTRRVIVYAGGWNFDHVSAKSPSIPATREARTSAGSPSRVLSVSKSETVVVEGVLHVPDVTPRLNSYAAEAAAARPKSSRQRDFDLNGAGVSPTLTILRRERNQSAQTAAEQAYEVEHQARLAAEAAEELADQEAAEAAEELKQTETLIRSLSRSSSSNQGSTSIFTATPDSKSNSLSEQDLRSLLFQREEALKVCGSYSQATDIAKELMQLRKDPALQMHPVKLQDAISNVAKHAIELAESMQHAALSQPEPEPQPQQAPGSASRASLSDVAYNVVRMPAIVRTVERAAQVFVEPVHHTQPQNAYTMGGNRSATMQQREQSQRDEKTGPAEQGSSPTNAPSFATVLYDFAESGEGQLSVSVGQTVELQTDEPVCLFSS